jgi:glycolate oxidase iron-sulfur subunit
MITSLPYIPDASECRTCSQCIGHCPTFSIKREENENPRGRLRLIERLLANNERLSSSEAQALDNCLQCRACERICPSKVSYGRLIELAITKLQTPSWQKHLLLHSQSLQRNTINGVAHLLRLYQRFGLQRLIRATKLLPAPIKRAEALLPDNIQPGNWQPYYPATGPRRGAAALFIGCIGSTFDHATRASAIKLLNQLGYDVHIPLSQQCCGALHGHNGAPEIAAQFAVANLSAFASDEFEAILYCDSGCGATLSEYGQLEALEPASNQRFLAKLCDLTSFLVTQPWPENITLAPLATTVAVHEPCTQRFPLGSQNNVYQLLKRIPDINLVPLTDNHRCCGAGGLHLLTTPHIAEPLRNEKLDAIRKSGAAIVVTSNIGCLMHIGAGLRLSGKNVEFVHPVTLIGTQI